MWIVYEHVNKKNGFRYIGITHNNPKYRWGYRGHKYNDSPKFWRAIKKYGWDNFEHNILFENLTEQEAKEKEKELICINKKLKISYNISDGGDGVPGITGWNKGKHLSEEHKRKISESSIGKPCWNKGGHLSEEHKRKIGDANKGKPMKPEVKEKLLKFHKGMPLSEETKRKISKTNKGKKYGPLSDEHRKKISVANKGKKRKPLSEETKRKISESHKGKKGTPQTEDTRKRISETMKRYWQNKKQS